MAPVTTQLGLLALASTVLAQPYHGHGAHRHRHSGRPYKPTGGAEGPYGYANGTLAGPTAFANGTGVGTVGRTSTQTQTSLVTVVPVAGTSSVASNNNAAATSAAAAAASSSSSCSDTVYVTYTPTVTVTAGAASANSSSAASSAASSSSEAAAAGTSASAYSTSAYPASASSPAASSSSDVAAAGPSAPAYPASAYPASASSQAASSSSDVAAQSTSAPVLSAAAYSAPASSAASSPAAYSAPESSSSLSAYSSAATSAYSPSSSYAASSTSSSAAASSSSTASPSGSPLKTKRGCNYNNYLICSAFSSGDVAWAYNWNSQSWNLSSEYTFIPTLHDTSSANTGSWSANANEGIKNGAPALFSFNEPDMPSGGGTNIPPDQASTAFNQYFSEFYDTDVQIGAPSVSSSSTPGQGLDWLSQFKSSSTAFWSNIDFINLHWYSTYEGEDVSTDVTNFQNYISGAYKQWSMPIWITEFAITGAPDAQVQSFLEAVVPWLEQQSYIHAYTYYVDAELGTPLTTGASSTDMTLSQAGACYQTTS